MTIGGTSRRCRSTLEIIRYEQKEDPSQLLKLTPDAVVVMMNPGSSKPERQNSLDTRTLSPQEIRTHCQLVDTCPDLTQYQIEQIMERVGFNHVRVLNFSDICEPDSRRFFQITSQIDSNSTEQAHSIFDSNRENEILCRMNPKRRIVIAGWGKTWAGRMKDICPIERNRRLAFARRCYDLIDNMDFLIVGDQDEEHEYIYSHPLPRDKDKKKKREKRERWVNKIVCQINNRQNSHRRKQYDNDRWELEEDA